MSYEYYSILGIDRSATADEIKKAYRKKAMELHPDRTGWDKEKETLFKQVGAARKHTMIKPVLRLDKVEDDLVDLNEDLVHRVLGDLVIYLSSFLMAAPLNSLVLMVVKMRKQNWSLILLIVTNDENSNSNMSDMICVVRVTDLVQNQDQNR